MWTSSCTVAFVGDEPIGVLLAAKRASASLIYRIGVHPDHVGKQHGSHLVTSLSQKLAILGPKRIFVEIPEEEARCRSFFEQCGFQCESWYRDLVAVGGSSGCPQPAEPITVSELEEAGAFSQSTEVSWGRGLDSLRRRSDQLEGWAVLSSLRVEAFLLASHASDRGISIERLGHSGTKEGQMMLTALLRSFVDASSSMIRIEGVSEGELSESVAELSGFRVESRVAGYTLEATPA